FSDDLGRLRPAGGPSFAGVLFLLNRSSGAVGGLRRTCFAANCALSLPVAAAVRTAPESSAPRRRKFRLVTAHRGARRPPESGAPDWWYAPSVVRHRCRSFAQHCRGRP